MAATDPQRCKYLIVGAGLSGLTIAHELAKKGESDFIVLEGRNRIGGRVHTKNNIDLGATWVHHDHYHMIQMLDDLGIQKYEQRRDGHSLLVHNANLPAHYFEIDKNEPTSYRISGGTAALIDTLANKHLDKTRLSEVVESIVEQDDGILVSTKMNRYLAEKAIITLPPRLAAQLSYDPVLPEPLVSAMHSTHTWMSNAIKVGLTFDRPFWRDKGLSGTLISQISPMTEVYDHSSMSGSTAALMGFAHEGLRNATQEQRKETILIYLEKHFGEKIREYQSYLEKDWSKEIMTTANPLVPLREMPRYGDSTFENHYLNNKLLFCGTETANVHGGYLEGAIISANRIVKHLTAQ